MSSAEMNEDEIDTETLQAQIDLSMSFAQSLVSSWIEPHKFPSSSRRKNIEQELTEYMKRPPRLGVGATLPEGAQNMTRETARLKGKLAGRKRPLEESYQSKSASDEEGESRATAIKKKARQDPFDVTHGKKRKKDKLKESERSSQPAVPSRPFDESKLDSSDEIEGLLKATDGPDEQSSPIKKNLASAKPTPERKDSSIVELKAISPSPSDETGSKSIQDTSSLSPVQSIQHSTVAGGSSIRTPKPHKSLPPELLKVPLLNLNGPPSDLESEEEQTTPSATTKKKRKRRKKKKNHAVPESADGVGQSSHHHPPDPSAW